jgi:hypothetical protein
MQDPTAFLGTNPLELAVRKSGRKKRDRKEKAGQEKAGQTK